MIIKNITVDNERYLIGFENINSSHGEAIKCYILKKFLFWKNIIYSDIYIKGLNPDYKLIAIDTILDYKRKCEQQDRLLNEVWD